MLDETAYASGFLEFAFLTLTACHGRPERRSKHYATTNAAAPAKGTAHCGRLCRRRCFAAGGGRYKRQCYRHLALITTVRATTTTSWLTDTDKIYC